MPRRLRGLGQDRGFHPTILNSELVADALANYNFEVKTVIHSWKEVFRLTEGRRSDVRFDSHSRRPALPSLPRCDLPNGYSY